MAYTIDTHAAIRDLTASGLPANQAEAIVATVAHADEAQRADIATRGDLATVRADLEAAVARLEGAIATSERRTILAVLAIAGVLFAALRLTG